jgi:DNA-binding protein YbaB
MNPNEQLEAFVREVEANLHRVQAAARQARAATLTVPIPGGFGTVTVTGAGIPVSVDLNRDTPRLTRGAALAKAITLAIHQAEDQAKANRQRAVADSRRQPGYPNNFEE